MYYIIKKKSQCWFRTVLLCIDLVFFKSIFVFCSCVSLWAEIFFLLVCCMLSQLNASLWASSFLFLHSMMRSWNWNEPMRFSIIEIINGTELCIIVSINVAKDLTGNRTRREIKREKTWVTMRDQGILLKTLPFRRQISLVCLLLDNSVNFCVLNYLKE